MSINNNGIPYVDSWPTYPRVADQTPVRKGYTPVGFVANYSVELMTAFVDFELKAVLEHSERFEGVGGKSKRIHFLPMMTVAGKNKR